MSKTFHHGDMNSPRIKKLLDHLKTKGDAGATTLELCDECVSTRASSDVSELRACLRLEGRGRWVETRFEGVNQNGRRVHRYVLHEETAEQRPTLGEAWADAQPEAGERMMSLSRQSAELKEQEFVFG